MAKKLDPAELVSFKELLMAYSIQIDRPIHHFLSVQIQFFVAIN
jgi:hypothetical protein